jgi:hypothetical protein
MAVRPGIGSEDAHVGCRHRVGDVAVEAGDPGDLDARAELELVPGDRRPDRLTQQLRLDTVRRQRVDQRSTTRLDFGLVDSVLRRPVEVVGGRQRPLDLAPRLARDRARTARQDPDRAVATGAALAACAPSGSPPSRRRRARRRTAPVPAARRNPLDRSSASTCCRTPFAALAADRDRHLRRHPCRCSTAGCAEMPRSAAARHPTQHATSTTMAPPEAMRLRSGSPTSAPTQPPAASERVEVGHDLVGAAHHVQQAQQSQAQQAPPIANRKRCRLCPLCTRAMPMEMSAIGTEEPAEPGEPTDQGFDTAADGTRPGRGRSPCRAARR